MKTKYYLIFLALLLSFLGTREASAQRCLVFGYDADGNRTQRVVDEHCYETKDREEVQEITLDDAVKVYPNPTDGIFKIVQHDGTNIGESFFMIYDINGIALIDGKMTDKEAVIDIGNLPSGTYLLKVSGDVELSKVIVKH